MHVNSQWDADYKELDDAFQQYRYDAQKAQSSKQAVIDKLKHQRDALTREVASLRDELNKSHKKIHSLRKSGDYTQRIQELEDEVALLRQQVSTTHTHTHTHTLPHIYSTTMHMYTLRYLHHSILAYYRFVCVYK